MATKDLTRVFYDGKIRIEYKDKAHRYFAYPRIDFKLPETERKAWGKVIYPKGTTTLIGDTLEKKGLMQWPKQVALRELFGFYDGFKGSNDMPVPAGFSRGVGTLWGADNVLIPLSKDDAVELIKSANDGWKRKQKKGADIGSIVHEAIENYIKNLPFDIGVTYMWNIKEGDYDTEALREQDLKDFETDVAMANLAFAQFVNWWERTTPTLYGAEELLYSMFYNVCGTYDACLGIKGEHHPTMKGKELVQCTVDWKTSKASDSKEAAMPEGINYQYFTQSAIYEMIRREMGEEPADDLLIVSARKDGGFSLVYASELGLSVENCIEAAKATIACYQFAEKAKKGLLAHAEANKQ